MFYLICNIMNVSDLQKVLATWPSLSNYLDRARVALVSSDPEPETTAEAVGALYALQRALA